MHHVAVRTALVAAVLALAAGAPATGLHAQAGPDDGARWHPAWGDWSIAFFLPDGGGAGVGFWNQRRPRLALGLRIDGALATETQQDPTLGDITTTDVRVAVGPALKWYWWQAGPVSPFLHSGLTAFYDRSERPGIATWRLGGGASLGIGADWFPTEGISIGGHTGIAARYSLVTDDDDASSDRAALGVDLFTSTLTFHLYF